MSFFTELKRRNVFKVGVTYVIVAWLLIQVASILFPTFDAPPWVMRVFIVVLIFGFPVAIILAWAYELTPEGIKPTSETQLEQNVTDQPGRKFNFLITGLLICVVVSVGLFWLFSQNETHEKPQTDIQKTVRTPKEQLGPDNPADTIAQIEKYTDQGQWEAAYTLAKQAQEKFPDNKELSGLWPGFSVPYALTSDPPGARVSRRAYSKSGGDWEVLGITPLENFRLPRDLSLLRIEHDGYEPVLRTQAGLSFGGEFSNETIIPLPPIKLDTAGSLPKDMVRIPGWTEAIAGEPVKFSDFFLGRHEVTNQEFKGFIDAGGYRRPEYWQYPIMRDGSEIPWKEAMASFVDRTGRPGPSTWEVGDYPEGQDNYPVGGVSWYEAAAYAQYVHQELPSVYHWRHAFSSGVFNELPWVMPVSNIEAKGPVPVGQSQAISWPGVFDMAGNVREWVLNKKGDQRFILGGGWNDSYYNGMDVNYVQPPLDRSPTNGFRLALTRDDAEVTNKARLPLPDVAVRDFAEVKPVSDEIFKTYQSMFSYDPTPLNAVIETTETTRLWKRERISLDAAYGNERVVLYLYLPVTGSPPYQTVVFWTGLLYFLESIDDTTPPEFIIKNGRAIAYPVFKGLFERGDRSPFPKLGTAANRDITIKWINDMRRSIDYLETRADVNPNKFSYFGISWGAGIGPLALSMEPRLQVGVLLLGGVFYNLAELSGIPLPEVYPVTYLPRVHVPVLLFNGQFDSMVPLETSAKPFYDLLGTKEPDKKHVIAPGGHFVPRNILIRETLDWLDKYSGPVD